MADTKISALGAATAATGGAIPVVQGGVTKKLTMTAAGATVAEAADAAAQRTALGAEIGTDVQAWGANLDAVAGLTSAGDKLPYFTGAGTADVTDFPSAARTLLAATDAAGERDALELGDSAILDVGTTTGTVAAGDAVAAAATAATDAQATADSAVSDAADAQDTANSAVTAASNAQDTADGAASAAAAAALAAAAADANANTRAVPLVSDPPNPTAGTVTLNGTTPVVVNTNAAKTASLFGFGLKTPGGTPGFPCVHAIVDSVSVAFKSTNAADTSDVSWFLLKQ